MAEPHVQGVHLSRTDENDREIEALAGMLGERVGLSGLLDDLKYSARRVRFPARLLGRKVSEAFRWDRHDTRDPAWYPQGISTSADASDTEVIDGRRILVTTWYSKKDFGSRVTFLDLDTLRYRHVLLVDPSFDADGNLRLEPLRIHAGGVVWAGPWLHVAATRQGFITARVEDIMSVPGDDERPDEFGITEGRVASYGHHHVLPVRFRYQAHADESHAKLRYSFLSLDRGSNPPAITAGEYGLSGQSTRLARYPLDPATWLLETGDDGFSRPLAMDEGGVKQMQGAVLTGGRYYVSVSVGPWWPGSVYVGTPGALKAHRWAVPMGPEDIAYWSSTDRLWTLTEHPRRRWILSMKRSSFD